MCTNLLNPIVESLYLPAYLAAQKHSPLQIVFGLCYNSYMAGPGVFLCLWESIVLIEIIQDRGKFRKIEEIELFFTCYLLQSTKSNVLQLSAKVPIANNGPDWKTDFWNWWTPWLVFHCSALMSHQCKFCQCYTTGATLRCGMTLPIFCTIEVHWEIRTKCIQGYRQNSSTTMNILQNGYELTHIFII
jgi:hypothetical protein